MILLYAAPRDPRRAETPVTRASAVPAAALAWGSSVEYRQQRKIQKRDTDMDQNVNYYGIILLLRQLRESGLSKTELLRMITSSAHLEIALGENEDTCYTVGNDEFSEKNRYEEYPVYLPRQYPKKPRKSLLYQWLSSLRWRLLHHNYTICERALM